MVYFSRDAILLIREINYIIGLEISLAVVDIITQCTSGWASASSSEVCHSGRRCLKDDYLSYGKSLYRSVTSLSLRYVV